MTRNLPLEYKMALVIRADLKMSTGKIVAQAAHAAVEASEEGKKLNHTAWKKWRDEGAKKVALQVDSYDELMEIKEKAEKLDIICVTIQDMGLTEVAPRTVTALGLGPERSDKLDKVTGQLPLMR